MEYNYDVVVIGAGSGGLTAAVGFQKIGKKVLLIERKHMGGECTNSGCIPSKALLHHAKSFYEAQSIAGTTKQTDAYRNKAFTYVRSIIDEVLSHETPEVFTQKGIDVVMGEAEFLSPTSLHVNDATYHFKLAIIATGSSPRLLAVPGTDQKDVLTNENLFELKSIPAKLLIVGGGPIGLEMGQALALLGSQVTILDSNDRFASLEDPGISTIIKKRFEALGIKIYLNASIREVTNRLATIHFTTEGESTKNDIHIAYDKILFAIGRVPNLPTGLTVAGIEADTKGVLVDSQQRTSNKKVYAIGDVAQRLKFTHTADDTARQVVARVASYGLLRVNSRKAVPKVTYTQPEMAQVGLSHTEALAKYTASELMRIEVPFANVDRAVTDANTDGLLVVIARRLHGTVLGAHIIGPRAGELITPFILAIDNKITLWRLQRTIFAYPTYSLVIKKAADQFVGEQLGTLKQDLLALLKRNVLKVIAGFLWVLLLILLYRYQTQHGMDVTQTALMIFDFVNKTAWGPLLYILFYTIRPITFFPATILTILSGVFFGLWLGTFLTVVGAVLSASVAYSVGRFFGTGLKLEDSFLGNWVEALRRNAFEAILTMRLLFFPFDGLSYAAGILKTRFLPFVSATFLGILLGTATFVSLGASLDVETFKMEGISFSIFNGWYLLVAACIFGLSLVLSHVLKRWKAVS